MIIIEWNESRYCFISWIVFFQHSLKNIWVMLIKTWTRFNKYEFSSKSLLFAVSLNRIFARTIEQIPYCWRRLSCLKAMDQSINTKKPSANCIGRSKPPDFFSKRRFYCSCSLEWLDEGAYIKHMQNHKHWNWNCFHFVIEFLLKYGNKNYDFHWIVSNCV